MTKTEYSLRVLFILLLIIGGVAFRYWSVKTSLADITGKEPTTSKILWYMLVWGK